MNFYFMNLSIALIGVKSSDIKTRETWVKILLALPSYVILGKSSCDLCLSEPLSFLIWKMGLIMAASQPGLRN